MPDSSHLTQLRAKLLGVAALASAVTTFIVGTYQKGEIYLKQNADQSAKQSLHIAWQALHPGLTSIEQYPQPGYAAGKIRYLEPELEVIVASAKQLDAIDTGPTTVAVDLHSTRKEIILYAKSRTGSIFKLTAPAGVGGATTTLIAHPYAQTIPWPEDVLKGLVLCVLLSVFAVAGADCWSRYQLRQAAFRAARHRLEWDRMLEATGDHGPTNPQDGYEVIAPEKIERPPTSDAPAQVEFIASVYRWDDRSGSWQRGKQVDLSAPEMPLVWAADTDIVVLVEAWTEFKERIYDLNHHRYMRTVFLLDGITISEISDVAPADTSAPDSAEANEAVAVPAPASVDESTSISLPSPAPSRG